jgi:hypothetical protein
MELWPYEKALAHSIKDFLAELCLIDASIIVSHVCNDLHGNIEDLVDSSAELHFKEGTLRYGHSADVNFEWGKSPVVTLDMEFIHQSVTVFFRIVLHGFYVGVAVQRILLSGKSGKPDLDHECFERALIEARLCPPQTAVIP